MLWLVSVLVGSLAAASPEELLERQRIMVSLERTLLGKMDELKARCERLEGFTANYRDADMFKSISERRQEERKQLEDFLVSYRSTLSELNDLRVETEKDSAMTFLSAVTKRKKSPAEAMALVAALKDIGAFTYRAGHARDRAWAALEAEEKAYQRAKEQWDRRRLRFWAVASMLCMLAASAALYLRLRGFVLPRRAALPKLPGSQVLHRRYRVDRELGLEDWGFVLEAVDLESGREIVVKRVLDKLIEGPGDAERFLVHAMALPALRHPNILEVHSAFKDDAHVYLAMELPPGEPLSRALASGIRFGMPAVQRALGQVAAALHHAHGRGARHGSLTPAKVFMSKGGLVKVADFGIEEVQARIGAGRSWGMRMVSPAYMAPEREVGEAGMESDIYSMGVILYEMATGRLPFEGPNFLAQKREMRYLPPSRVVAGLSREIDPLVWRALQPEAAKRFRSAEEFSRSLAGLRVDRY